MKSPAKICLVIALCSITFCGCGPSAEQLADQQARQEFREAVAAMKVCTQDTTYQEFREKREALETCYTANQSALDKTNFTELAQVMDATDALWREHNQLSAYPELNDSDVPLPTKGELWDAMLIVNPAVASKSDFTEQQRKYDPDFYAMNEVRRGLKSSSRLCDELLTGH
jgi:hypothetical protein